MTIDVWWKLSMIGKLVDWDVSTLFAVMKGKRRRNRMKWGRWKRSQGRWIDYWGKHVVYKWRFTQSYPFYKIRHLFSPGGCFDLGRMIMIFMILSFPSSNTKRKCNMKDWTWFDQSEEPPLWYRLLSLRDVFSCSKLSIAAINCCCCVFLARCMW